MSQDDSVARLGRLLNILDSQIILEDPRQSDHPGGRNSKFGMQEGVNMEERNTEKSHLPTTTAWIFKVSQTNKHLWPLSMVQIKAFLGVSTFLVGKFWGYSHKKLTNFKTCLWTCNMCHMESEHTR